MRSRAVYLAYAAARGKERWGDKTPMYMQHLADARAALPRRALRPPDQGRPRRRRVLPRRCRRASSRARGRTRATRAASRASGARRCSRRAPSGRASARATSRCAMRRSSRDARARAARDLRSTLGLAFEPAMLGYADEVDVSVEAAPAEPAPAADAGPPRLAHGAGRRRTRARSRRWPATCSPSSAIRRADSGRRAGACMRTSIARRWPRGTRPARPSGARRLAPAAPAAHLTSGGLFCPRNADRIPFSEK